MTLKYLITIDVLLLLAKILRKLLFLCDLYGNMMKQVCLCWYQVCSVITVIFFIFYFLFFTTLDRFCLVHHFDFDFKARVIANTHRL